MLSRRAFLAGAAAAGAAVAGAGLAGAAPRLPWSDLARQLSGRVVLPGDAAFAALAAPNNLRYASVLPAGIARCADARDVSTAIRWAREHGVRIVARSGGHSYAGTSTTRGLLVDVRAMNRVALDDSGLLTVGGGARNADVEAYLRGRDIAITHGRCPGVGIAGLALGGGIGFNMRAHGITCDRLDATEIVTADGAIRRVREGDDLFWACSGGGGGNFGINTAFSLRAYDVGPRAVCSLVWETRVEEVFATLAGLLERAPEALGSKLSAVAATANAGIKVTLLAQLDGSAAALRELLAPAYALAAPSGRIEMLPYWEAQRFLSEPGVPAYFQERSRFFRDPFDHRAVAAVFEGLRRAPRSVHEAAFKIFQTGGRIDARAPGASAFVHRANTWLSSIELYWTASTPPAMLAQHRAWLDGYYARIVPLARGGAYQNFLDPSLRDRDEAYYGANLARLEAIKRRVDPSGLFASSQSIPD